jgi:Flp pilus assembly protein, ATPase CpaF
MTDAVRLITDRVRDRVRRETVDDGAAASTHSGHRAAEFAREEVRRYSERALSGAVPMLDDEAGAERQIVASIVGFGALQPYLDDPEIEEIWINAPSRVFIARGGMPELTQTVLGEGEVRALVERMLQSSGRRVDLSSPFVDATLPDGSRLHVVIPDITKRHWAVNIRKFSARIRELHQLVALGSLTRQAAEFLRLCLLADQNILVAGATQSGKTTMLNALLSTARPTERIVTVEETFELDLIARDVVAMQCRQPSLEGTGEITLRRLIKEAMRMRPDRLVVGEVREAESLDLLLALNAGLPGACSIHANSARDALSKLCTLPLLAGRNIDSGFVVPTVANCIDIVVFCTLERSGVRRVTEIIAPSGQVSAGTIEVSPIFALRGGELMPTGGYPMKRAKFEATGLDPAVVLGRSDA